MNAQTNRPWIWLALVILLALLLRLPNLGDSFYGDEEFTLLRDSDHFLTRSDDCHRPVFFTLLFLWRTMGFDGEIGLRMLPLLFGLLSVPLAWAVGKHLGGRGFALGFSLLLATSPVHIEFSQELRMYSLLVLLALAQLLCYLDYRQRRRISTLVLGALVGLVGMYTHLFYGFCLGGFALLALLDRQAVRWKPFWISLIAVALLYLPNLGNILWFYDLRNVKYKVHLPSALPKLAASFTVGFNLFDLPELGQGRGIGGRILIENWHYVLPCLLIFGLLLFGAVRTLAQRKERFALFLTTALLIVPALLAYGFALATKKNIMGPKYLIFLLPFVLLLFAWGFQGLRTRALQVLIGLGYAFLVGISLLHFYTDPVHYGRRVDWRGAADYLKGRVGGEAPLVLLKGYAMGILQYYGYETRPYWIRVDGAGDSVAVAEYLPYLQPQLTHARKAFYLREDDLQNAVDPNDIVLKSLRVLGTDEVCIPYNPRLRLYGWRLH
ncbi:MAG: glycosyltransferase family 39 protein [bacterium]